MWWRVSRYEQQMIQILFAFCEKGGGGECNVAKQKPHESKGSESA